MAPVVIRRSVEDLREERRALLAGVSMSGRQLRERASRDELTGDEWDAFERLREINFLLRNAAKRD
jgi:hypothetical protein